MKNLLLSDGWINDRMKSAVTWTREFKIFSICDFTDKTMWFSYVWVARRGDEHKILDEEYYLEWSTDEEYDIYMMGVDADREFIQSLFKYKQVVDSVTLDNQINAALGKSTSQIKVDKKAYNAPYKLGRKPLD